MRSNQGYYTRSHQNSEVKRLWAGIVLGWVTSREVPPSPGRRMGSWGVEPQPGLEPGSPVRQRQEPSPRLGRGS
ncbi:unnamed protein product [Sphagnum compactum]